MVLQKHAPSIIIAILLIAIISIASTTWMYWMMNGIIKEDNAIIKERDNYVHNVSSKCNNINPTRSAIHDLNITLNHNWLPYYSRCEFERNATYNYGAMQYGFLTKQLVYSHVFKSGGTTIEEGIKSLIKDNKMINVTKYKHNERDSEFVTWQFFAQNKNKIADLKPFLEDNTINTLIFTFIRDPITKFLASFFEINRRAYSTNRWDHYMREIITNTFNITWSKYSKMNTTQVLKDLFIHKLLHPNAPKGSTLKLFFEPHLYPNTFFLMPTLKQSQSLPFDYIGNLKNMAQDLPKILAPFIIDDKLRNNDRLLMSKYFPQQRSRLDQSNTFSVDGFEHFSNKEIHAFFDKYALDVTQLDDEMIQSLCEIYWFDYLCFPFEIPQQCNIQQLFIKHYDVDIRYKSCD